MFPTQTSVMHSPTAGGGKCPKISRKGFIYTVALHLSHRLQVSEDFLVTCVRS